jgi:hypothetical protein
MRCHSANEKEQICTKITKNLKSILRKANPGLGCSSVVQRLPSMSEALGSIPAPKNKTQKKKKKKRKSQKITCGTKSFIKFENSKHYKILEA